MKYRKKPIVIEAEQFILDSPVPLPFDKESICCFDGKKWYIKTLEGEMTISENDWVIKGVAGEFYPCKPNIFEKTYDVIE